MSEIGRPRKVRGVVVGGKEYPCFQAPVDLAGWRAMLEPLAPLHTSPCVDCTPAYRDQMLSARKCLHPETLFIHDEDGFVTGINREDRRWAGLAQRAVAGGECRLTLEDAELFGWDLAAGVEKSSGAAVRSEDTSTPFNQEPSRG